ncbi:TetR/AcrR family transcriptional regulator [Paractinoplanes rhizophilus]|jgi:AcrR family transcriptional regulator|uniref:TetR/AcrR family transcriptional regulator n=1 Tax=Paractinoplanes rhizophilus TaxID=1416877 RepID=A0ABW2HJE3_9ACTN|nr:TetR/AcrR family transcriptional regulator [Actinoplanes sp.]
MTAPQRRNPQTRDAILAAAFELCHERGYAAVTIEGVAARAGVGKQSIYRWWPSKGLLVLDAFRDHLDPRLATPPAADLPLAGLPELLQRTAALLSDPRYGRMLADLVAAAQHDPALAKDFHEKVYRPNREGTLDRIHRAQRAGELRDIDPDLVADLLFGPLWFRLLLMQSPPTPEYANRVIETTLAGLRPA